MATKNCPHCQKQVPVACKKCGCGHVFFTSRRYMSRESSSECVGTEKEIKEEKEIESESLQPRRRTGRVQREKPNFYDALQYENQIRKQKLLLRKQVKTSKAEDSQGSNEESSKTKDVQAKSELDKDVGSSGTINSSQAARSSRLNVHDESEPKKRRRGRPPGITGGRKPGGSSARIQGTMTLANNLDGNQDKEASGLSREEEEEDIMADISPEKALQYNIVLQEINRKWVNAGWKAD